MNNSKTILGNEADDLTKTVGILLEVEAMMTADAGEAHNLLEGFDRSAISGSSIDGLNKLEKALFDSDLRAAELILNDLKTELAQVAAANVSAVDDTDVFRMVVN